MILNWMWLREFSWERSVYVTLKKKKKKNMRESCTRFILIQWIMVEGCMDSNVFSWCVFYLECDKGKESSSY